jgi:hypothetical protein
LIFDRSSSPQNQYYGILYNGTQYGGFLNASYFAAANNLNRIYLPSFTEVRLVIWSEYAEYFDAWYLLNLGVNPAYAEGYEDGYDFAVDGEAYDQGYQDGLRNNPNILLNGFQAMVGILVNFALMILNLNVFGVSLLNIFGILALFVGLIWILKIVRG